MLGIVSVVLSLYHSRPGLDNDILPMLSFPGCLLVALELANVVVKLHQFYVKLPSTCHVGTSAYSGTSGSLFYNKKIKMRNLIVRRKTNPLFVQVWDRKCFPLESQFAISWQAS